MSEKPCFDVLIVVTASDCERLLKLYDRLIDAYEYGKVCFVGNEAVRDVIFSSNLLKDRVSWIDENSVIEFNEVHELMKERLAEIIGDDDLPRGITGWYYQQFLKMQYSSICADEYYMVWDGDTIPCRKINMFTHENKQPYIDMKHEYHPEYFDTIGKILPGFRKVIERSFISEHMLIRCDIMKNLINDIEKNEDIKGEKFWEKILNAIEPKKIYDSSFSEFETYGTYVALRYPLVYKLRDWHSFRLGATFFDKDMISDRDFEWLGKDFDAISFEKGQKVREDHKNIFDNPEYQEKLSAKKLLQLAQMEFDEGYKEIWQDDILTKKSANVNKGDFSDSINKDNRVIIAVLNNGTDEQLNANLDSIREVLNEGSYITVIAELCEGESYGACYNRTICEVDKEYSNCDILLLDSSTRLIFDTLYYLKQALYSGDKIGAVGCVSNNADNKQKIAIDFENFQKYIDFGYKNNVPMENPCIERVTLSSFALLIKRKAWNEVGGFDTEYFGKNYGDAAFSLKLTKKGYRLMLARNSFIYNHELLALGNYDEMDRLKFIEKNKFDISDYKYADVSKISMISFSSGERVRILCDGCGLGADIKALRYLFPNSEIVGVEEKQNIYEIVKKSEDILSCLEEVLSYYGEKSFEVILIMKKDGNEKTQELIKSLVSEKGMIID